MKSFTESRRVRLSILAMGILSICHSLLAAEPFDYFRNSWSVIGLKDY